MSFRLDTLRLVLKIVPSASLCLLGAQAAQAAEADCAKITGRTVPAAVIKLPTRGATQSATYVPSENGKAAFCKIIGQIHPVDRTAPDIVFELNLPDTWNGKALQYGGRGLNGDLVTGLLPVRDAPPGPTPVDRGYATFGNDGGHQNSPDRDLQTFALNKEALHNHAYGANKKTYDASLFLIQAYYGKRAGLRYFFGGSEGGRESMIAAQRFPNDYNGIISAVGLMSWTGVNIAAYRQWQAMRAGGWLSPAKIKLVQNSALAACDAQDGLQDGVIARYEECQATAQLHALRCPDGADTGETCLSDKQIAMVELIRTKSVYGVTLNHGETEMVGYPVGGEANENGYSPLIMPKTAPAPGDSVRDVFAVGDIAYFIVRDGSFRAPLDTRKYAARLKAVSVLMDATDPDLSRFKARGGKLIMKGSGSDYLIPSGSIYRYYESVRAKMGPAVAEQFARLYVSPWTSHFGQGTYPDGTSVPTKVDLLTQLENWVEKGVAPPDMLSSSAYKGTQAVRSWPICRYGKYPHYSGSGDVTRQENYTCASLDSRN